VITQVDDGISVGPQGAGLLSLTVGADGTATGGLVNTTVSFMDLRTQRIPQPKITEVVHDTNIPEVSDTDLHASHVGNDDGRWCVWFLDVGTRSWARFDYQPGTSRWPVYQSGHADFGMRSLPPNSDGNAPVGRWPPNCGSPSHGRAAGGPAQHRPQPTPAHAHNE
jgi:hypothetical protein